ncbi:PREDICTED: uncharacterized protein LOC105365276 [Ceratosolen solmsi marchali]|uniref:Uncharacterized protein LOC105365276 n=1 Tax=Ceratosolen solmsi marchali TaxID=326594 RepID=A0AAJ6YP65_9HYME|nr:PREDICTED: uncharacterized protein LOC105365276 [Ceratosolen solmsi marchali]
MTTMLRLELSLVLLSCTQILMDHHDFHGHRSQYNYRNSGGNFYGTRTREIQIKYGRLRGTIVQPRTAHLQLIDVFLGVPYAEPPIGHHRFEPPTTQTPWTGVRHFDSFAPVCPQVLPNTEEEIDTTRHRYLKRLLPFLQNQSEDCLYLNIYAPHQNNSQRNKPERFPVIVFIHGESYEWNSGNPYDGSVLAAYGNIVFVTVNFRLGILGFLRPGTKDNTACNFGLLDQIAALAWLKDNIGQFGGDPDRITLLGHGTGAVFVNLLLLSPIDGLFKRAILMSGSALNPDAIGKAPLQITKQVAYALNCPQVNDEELAACLKNRSVHDLLNVKIHKPKYVPAFAPLIDSAVIPDKPLNLMKNAERLAKFDLMYGVTELEKFHILPGVALLEGLSDLKRNELIRDSVKATHELEPELILRRVLEHYEEKRFYTDHQSQIDDKNEWNRDLTLDVISDSGVVAPIISMANLHSRVNPKSYMYVYSHRRSIRDSDDISELNIQLTVHGEELPYVLGIPQDAEGYHLNAPYDNGEAILSKAMMDWWCNFAYYGNPNNIRPLPRRLSYLREEYNKIGSSYQIDWPAYDPENQAYFNLTTPPQIGHHYRISEMQFWNEAIPHLLRRPKAELSMFHDRTTRRPRPELLDILDRQNVNESIAMSANVLNSHQNSTNSEFEPPSNLDHGKVNKSNESKQKESNDDGSSRNSSAVSLVIVFGVVFLLLNAMALVYLYHKRQRMRDKATNSLAQMVNQNAGNSQNDRNSSSLLQSPTNVTMKRSKGSKTGQQRELGYCSSASKPDIHELIKNDKAYDNNSNFGRRSREDSSSTIDTKIKVREWIQQEIVHRCSPRFLRKTRETLQREHRERINQQQFDSKHEPDNEHKDIHKDEDTLYKDDQQISVRSGYNTRKVDEKLSKVSVAVDATPAARTDSILNQIPIELTRTGTSSEYLDLFDDNGMIIGASEYCEPTDFQSSQVNEAHTDEEKNAANIVMIEHHHSKSDPLPLDKIPSYNSEKVILSTAQINESDSGSASSLYAKINPRMKCRLPVHQYILQKQLQQQESMELAIKNQSTISPNASTTLPRLLTFGAPLPELPSNPEDVNVTCREVHNEISTTGSPALNINSHEEALRTIRRRNYPKVLPDIEKRRSLPPNASFVEGPPRYHNHFYKYRHGGAPPSPPPRTYSTSRSLDCVEDNNEEELDEVNKVTASPVTTILHVGPLRKKTDYLKNKSVPSLADNFENPHLSSSASLPICPIHGTSRDPIVPGAKSEPRIVITPRIDINQQLSFREEELVAMGVDQPDCPRRIIPERSAKQPRIIIKPTGTLPRSQANARTNKPIVSGIMPANLHENETYQRLLARREKMPLPGELGCTRIPSCNRRREAPPTEQVERIEFIQSVNDATATKL